MASNWIFNAINPDYFVITSDGCELKRADKIKPSEEKPLGLDSYYNANTCCQTSAKDFSSK